MNIVLTGFMGTGKTVVGKKLVKKLGKKWRYIDTDERIEMRAGMKISDIFSRHGEPYFRDMETNIIRKVSEFDNCVIATGGGVVLRKENMDMLEKNGVVINLKATPETIYNRISSSKDRPLLNKPEPMAEIVKMLDYREPFYKRCRLSINTDQVSAEEIADTIISYVKQV